MSLCSSLSRESSIKLYAEIVESKSKEAIRRMCKEDLFFLLLIAFKRLDVNRDWLYDRCREVEEKPNGYLDLWAREHYKSTLITYAKTIQDILCNPDITVGIFSHTRPIAKGFLEQIKRELEENTFLKFYFDDVLYENPASQSPVWSLDGGLLVKRKSNPKEKTVEAWGLVDGQPTSKHYSLLIYDDVVTLESVSTPEQIQKVTNAWAMSLNLGAAGGARRYIGTRYHFNDTYKDIMDREAAIPRIYAATEDGTLEGKPRLLSRETLAEKRKQFGPYVYSSQMLQNPVADSSSGFQREWLQHFEPNPKATWTMNKYILVDPASEKKKTNDYTVMLVIGLAADGNYYIIEAIRDRINLTERAKRLFDLVRKHKPLKVGYEKYGIQADIEHIEYLQGQENYRFHIVALGGQTPKNDRIRRLIPIFEQRRMWLPHKLVFVDNERNARDFVAEFIKDEYLAFPVSGHDDMLDCMARIADPEFGAKFPEQSSDTPFDLTGSGNTATVETEYDLFA